MSEKLFDVPQVSPPQSQSVSPGAGAPRLRRPNRRQVELRSADLDSLLADDHPARAVWAYVEGLDLSALVDQVRAVAGRPGRPATDPALLLALWLYATLDGVGSARRLARLCRSHDAYRWLCGGVGVNHHTLSDFRVAHPDVLDALLTQSVASLVKAELVTMTKVAQDGMRVRASAGAGSFRRKRSLKKLLLAAEKQVKRLREELDDDPGRATRREQSARQRAAEDRARRVAEALAQQAELEARKPKRDKDKARASTTDPEARVMKMADGGFRPAYNMQYATDVDGQVIVGVDVDNVGSDRGRLRPMSDQLQRRYGRRPQDHLADGGFVKLSDIEATTAVGSTVYTPAQRPRDPSRDPYTPRPTDSPVIAAWRRRMGTPEAKKLYRMRAATAEWVNALARNRGLRLLTLRGTQRVRCVALLYALAHNVWRTIEFLGRPT